MRKNSLVIIAIVFSAVTFSFCGLLLAARYQLNSLTAVPMEEGDTQYPKVPLGYAQQGEEHYQTLGCVNCHTQVVRRQFVGADFEQGWAISSGNDDIQRQTVPRDYLYQKHSTIGINRIGPDLTNIGARMTADELHRYLLTQHDLMPSYQYLYEIVPAHVSGYHVKDLPAALEVNDGQKVIASEKAIQLVSYLSSLNKNYPLPSAPALIELVEEAVENEADQNTATVEGNES